MKMTKKTATILSLSAVALLVVVVVIIVVRRRGRKESEGEIFGNATVGDRLAAAFGRKVDLLHAGDRSLIEFVYYNDFQSSMYFQGNLYYVVVPNDANEVEGPDGQTYIQIAAIGQKLPGGSVKKIVLSGDAYIRKSNLAL